MKKKRILITGSRGFIGTHLGDALMDNYNLNEFDLKLKRDLFAIENLVGVDVVVHLAALTSVQESRNDPQRYFWTNVMGTAHMLELCVKYKVQLIHFSSAAAGFPLSSPYAYTKWMSEELVIQMQKAVRGIIFRPENVYGIGMNTDSLFARFLHNDSLTVYGDGKQTRDFIHVRDIVNITRFAIANDWENVRCDLGTGQKTSVGKIAELFHRHTGKRMFAMDKVQEIRHSKANVRKLAELYPYPLTTNLEEDIRQLVEEVQ